MTLELFIALMAYTLSTSITPGPNNIILLSSGATHGFARTLPVMSGMVLGFVIMVFAIGLSLMQIFETYPAIQDILKIFGLAYTVYLAWGIIQTRSMGKVTDSGAPLSFLKGALFQWLNPKAWIMALTSITLYAPENSLLQICIVSGAFAFWGAPTVMLWTAIGMKIRALLRTKRRLQGFNFSMGVLLICSVLPVIWL